MPGSWRGGTLGNLIASNPNLIPKPFNYHLIRETSGRSISTIHTLVTHSHPLTCILKSLVQAHPVPTRITKQDSAHKREMFCGPKRPRSILLNFKVHSVCARAKMRGFARSSSWGGEGAKPYLYDRSLDVRIIVFDLCTPI